MYGNERNTYSTSNVIRIIFTCQSIRCLPTADPVYVKSPANGPIELRIMMRQTVTHIRSMHIYINIHFTYSSAKNGLLIRQFSVTSYQGEVLRLTKVSRSEMGAYLCIGSNGVPPSVSKRIIVSVHFHPVISAPSQLVGAPKGTEVKLECNVEAFPKSINYWVRESGDMVITSDKYQTSNTIKSIFEDQMILTVKFVEKQDLGSFRCIAKNSLGEVESSIRLYEIPGPKEDGDEYDDNAGSSNEYEDSVPEVHDNDWASDSNDRNRTKHKHQSNDNDAAAPSPSISVRLLPPLYWTLKYL